MELLKQQAGIELTHVPYKGGGPAALGVMAGDVAAMFGGGSVTSLIQSGKLRGLAVSGRAALAGAARPAVDLRALPVLRGHAVAGPVRARRNAGRRDRAAAHGGQRGRWRSPTWPRSSPPPAPAIPISPPADEFAARIRADYDKYGKVIKASGLRVE